MTPFGQRVRELRAARGITLRKMSDDLGVSPAYLSSLEHGHRGRPSWRMVQDIIGYFEIIWDQAEELERLAQLSHPRIAVATPGLKPIATELANRLAEDIAKLPDQKLKRLLDILDE